MQVTNGNKKPIKQHFLKTIPVHFAAISSGEMTAQVRFDDRGFEVGDDVILVEYIPHKNLFTGNSTKRTISSVVGEGDLSGLQAGYVLLSHAA